MEFKVTTQYNYKGRTGEHFELPSLTDQLCDEPLSRIVERYVRTGTPFPGVSDDGLDGAIDEARAVSALDDFSAADVSGLDKVEQADVLVTAERLGKQLRATQARHGIDGSNTRAKCLEEKADTQGAKVIESVSNAENGAGNEL